MKVISNEKISDLFMTEPQTLNSHLSSLLDPRVFRFYCWKYFTTKRFLMKFCYSFWCLNSFCSAMKSFKVETSQKLEKSCHHLRIFHFSSSLLIHFSWLSTTLHIHILRLFTTQYLAKFLANSLNSRNTIRRHLSCRQIVIMLSEVDISKRKGVEFLNFPIFSRINFWYVF